jgi:putative transposase
MSRSGGNRKADVFQQEDDHNVYLSVVNKYATEYGVEIWSYCLMTNHVHLVLVPGRPQGSARQCGTAIQPMP